MIKAKLKKDGIDELILAKGHTEEVLCVDLDNNGNGIAFIDKKLIIIPGVLPDEIVVAQLTYRKGSIWIAKLIKIIKESKARINPKCNIAFECGACSLQHTDNNSQLSIKYNKIISNIERIGKIKFKILPIIKNESRFFNYRNKAIIPIRRKNNNDVIIGYYRRGTNDIIELEGCPVLENKINNILPKISKLLSTSNLDIASHNDRYSGLRHICIRTTSYKEQLLITFVGNIRNKSELKYLAEYIYNNFTNVIGVVYNIQANKTNKIFGETSVLLAGIDNIIEVFCSLRFNLTSTTFFQVNKPLAEVVVEKIVAWIKSKKDISYIIDAYCGVGTISLPIAKTGIKVLGLELNKESIKQAKLNARINNLTNARFEYGDVNCLLSKYISLAQVIIFDPPRKGLSKLLKEIIKKNQPKYIVYLSCNPSTMARDLNYIINICKFYELEMIQPIDFFPQTSHIECLAFLKSTNF